MELHEEASRILNHPIVSKFFEEYRKKYHSIIENSLFAQDELRTDSYLMLRAINEFEQCLKDYVAMGEMKPQTIVRSLKSLD